jgi:hypothetical protein
VEPVVVVAVETFMETFLYLEQLIPVVAAVVLATYQETLPTVQQVVQALLLLDTQ